MTPEAETALKSEPRAHQKIFLLAQEHLGFPPIILVSLCGDGVKIEAVGGEMLVDRALKTCLEVKKRR